MGSLTSHICKLMDRNLKRESFTFSVNNLIKSTLHRFVKNRSFLTNFLTFLETVTGYSGKGLPVYVVYIVLAEAYEKVPHDRLAKKLGTLNK